MNVKNCFQPAAAVDAFPKIEIHKLAKNILPILM